MIVAWLRRWAAPWVAVCVIAGCANQAPEQSSSGAAPSLSDKLDCHAEAKRLAEQQYPRNSGISYGGEAASQWWMPQARYEAENRNFHWCLRRKGFGGAYD